MRNKRSGVVEDIKTITSGEHSEDMRTEEEKR
jgi:hypothetical protein